MTPTLDRKDDPGPDEEITATRRHRSNSRIRLDGLPSSPTLLEPSLVFPTDLGGRPPRSTLPGALTDELRAALWDVVATSLFAPTTSLDRVWTAPPLGGDLDRMPEDVAEVIEGWFSLVEPADVYAFIEAVLENVEPALKVAFATAVNAVLEGGQSDHRIVMRKLVPVAAKADISALERAFAACRTAVWTETEAHLVDALMCLATKPQPDVDGAIREAVRTVELAAAALIGATGGLDDSLELLEAKGYIAKALKNAYAGLFTYVTNGARRATTDDARLVLVMCAGFVNHLATQVAGTARSKSRI